MSKYTTDEWSERFFAQAVKDIDCHIKMHCGSKLDEEEKYTLRRHIMITLRHGPVGVDHLTDEIDSLKAEVDTLKAKLEASETELRIRSESQTVALAEVERLKASLDRMKYPHGVDRLDGRS